MLPISYLTTTPGLIWTIACLPIGLLMAVLAYVVINKVPAKWLCDYEEEPSEELLSGKRIKFNWTVAVVAIITAACLILCRLQFNKGYDIYFGVFALVIWDCLLITISDAKYQIIPDQFTAALAVLAVLISVYDLVRGFHILHTAWWSPLAGMVIGAATMLAINFIGGLVYHREGMGFGDVKLFAAVGILTGFPGTIYTFLISLLLATVFFTAILLIRRVRNRDTVEETVLQDSEEAAQEDPVAVEAEKSDQEETEEDPDEPGGPRLAFGPYIAGALVLYVILFDTIRYLVSLYLSLF